MTLFMAFDSLSLFLSAIHDLESKHRRNKTCDALKRQIESSFLKQFFEGTFQTIAFSKKTQRKESKVQQVPVEEFSEIRSKKAINLL